MRISDWSSDVCSSDRIVPGGGTALLYATKVLEGMKGVNEDQTRGIDIVRKALQAPLRQIAQNAGHDGAVVAGKLIEQADTNFGFHAQTEVYEDLVDRKSTRLNSSH